MIKKSLAAVAAGAENRIDVVKSALRTLDKTVTKGVLHKKAAARRKSRIARALNAAA